MNTKIICFSVIVCLVLFTSGCMENLKQNSTERQITLINSPTPLTAPQSSISVSETQNHTGSPSPSQSITTMRTVTPHFHGTISYGSNRSSALTEDQAWKYAEAFFLKARIQDIQPSEIERHGQYIWKDKDNNQKMVWTFHVHRIVDGVNYGGSVFIDAYDGHIVSYSGYQ